MQKKDSNFVFLDPRGKRWPRLRMLIAVLSLAFFIALVLFIQSLFIIPHLHMPSSVMQLQDRLKVLAREEGNPASKNAKQLWLKYSRGPEAKVQQEARLPAQTRGGSHDVVLGSYVSWNPRSYESLSQHADQLTHVSADWMTVLDGMGTISTRFDPNLVALVRSKGIVLLPVLDNLVDDVRQPEAVEALANGPVERQDRFVANLLGQLKSAGAGGIILDWGQIDPNYIDPLTDLIEKICAALHQDQMEVWLRVPMGLELEAFDLEALAETVDRFIAELHDENSENDPAGPIASQEWFEGWLKAMIDYGDPSQWIIDLGVYGYDWEKDASRAEVLSFHDVMSRAGRAGVPGSRSEEPFWNPHFGYEDEGNEHTIWFLDAVTFLNQARTAREHKVGGIGIQDLGYEDPGIWQSLPLSRAGTLTTDSLVEFEVLRAQETVTHVGKGKFLTVEDSRSDGARHLWLAESGAVEESYEGFPSYLTLCSQGEGEPDQVAISFDDGPDSRWTPKILDILKKRGVKASFFLVGSRIEFNHNLVRRIKEEGHEIGVHTYTHPNMALISEERSLLEFNATQRIIEAVTGRSTLLFRPPFNADANPQTADELVPVKLAQALGYLTVTEDIDPEDWLKPGADAILNRVKHGRRTGGNIILLHDAGGDRSQTVKALPLIIDYLQDRGDRIVSLSEMLGEPMEYLMPALEKEQEPVTLFLSSNGFRALHGLERFLWAFMIAATVLVAARTLLVVLLAVLKRKPRRPSDSPFHPPVSVIMAAYNEEKVIAGTLRSVLASDYPGQMEVIVVNDGSSDLTGSIVAKLTETDRRLVILNQENLGKAMALRTGVAAASNDILVMLDADTQFSKATIHHLVGPMEDEKVGAVSGHAKVGNISGFITRCQALEYTCGFNLDRRAYDRLNCITVVPGAVSSLRRSALQRVGGLSDDTLAEDTDLTLTLHRFGYRVVYVPEAIAWTEAPENLRSLAKQRFRWAFGTLQCLWKHRDMLFNTNYGALGWFALPSLWFFQIALIAIGPFIDFALLISVFLDLADSIYLYLGMFLLMDLILAGIACIIEKEPVHRSLLIIPMRFVYRPLLSWVIWRSIGKAIKGALVGWGKIERTASISNHL